MSKYSLLFFALWVSLNLSAQELQVPDTADNNRIFTIVENMPAFPGGDDGLMSFIKNNTHYPQTAFDKGIEGKVVVRLVVNQDGSTSNIKILKPLTADLDSEAVRVVKLLPKFSPGKQQGIARRVYFNIPITFRIKIANPFTDSLHLAGLPVDTVYHSADQEPEFIGGDGELMHFLQKHIQYPANERAQNIQGKVMVRFIVDRDGAVTNIKVAKSVSPGLDKEAVRVITLLPKFKPALKDGKPVRVYFNLPVAFRLSH